MSWEASSFEKESELGKGARAIVYLGLHKQTGARYALKEINLKYLDSSEKRRIDNEEYLFRSLACETGDVLPPGKLCRYFGSFGDEMSRTLVLEWVEGEPLHQKLKRDGPWDFESGRSVIASCVEILASLHACNIVYRDLKLANLILHNSGSVRLVDLGLSKRLDSSSSGLKRTYSTVGTPHAMAPEMFMYGDEMNEDGFYEVGYQFSVDWWTLGILVCEILAGIPPFGYRDDELGRGSIEDLSKGSPANLDWQRLGKLEEFPAAKEFVIGLLDADPTQRLGSSQASEIKDHAFFHGFDWTSIP